jgi:hypothetical protein
MNRKTRTFVASAGLLAAAFSGMLAGCHNQSNGSDAGSMTSSDPDKHACKGQNACKGSRRLQEFR